MNSMINIDKILADSQYVPTTHELYKSRKDGISKFFKYIDNQGRGVYFGIALDKNGKDGNSRYFLYAVTDE